MSERQGIEIDYCPTCRGVWLDRGELDKIIERSAPADEQPRGGNVRAEYRPEPRYDDRQQSYYKHKKKKGFLSDIFDFD
jgi:Zn-finger nucleic acid-binding protein